MEYTLNYFWEVLGIVPVTPLHPAELHSNGVPLPPIPN